MFIFSFLSYTAPQVFHCSVFSFTQSFHIYLRCFMFLKSSIVLSLLSHVFYGSAFVFAVSGFLWEGTEGIKDDNWPWASWSPSARSSWWWGRPPTPQTSWWRRSAPCLCSGTWRRRRRSPLRSFRSSRTSPSSGCTGWHPEGGKQQHLSVRVSGGRSVSAERRRRRGRQRGQSDHLVLLCNGSIKAGINSESGSTLGDVRVWSSLEQIQ